MSGSERDPDLSAPLTYDRSAILVGGEVLIYVHEAWRCVGRPCCIHSPSDHHMSSWRQHFRDDKGMMERLCEHGIGHPDPDDMAWRSREDRAVGVHGCDGCCRTV